MEDYTFRLPWRAGMISVNVNWDKTQFVGTDGTSPPSVMALPPPALGAGVFVSFHLGAPVRGHAEFGTPASVPFINGALHLVWSAGGSAQMPAPSMSVQAKQDGVFQKQSGVGAQGQAKNTGIFAPPKPMPAQTTTAANDESEMDEAEHMLAAAASQLSPEQQKAIAAARILPGAKPPVAHPLPRGGTVQVITQAPSVVPAARLHAVRGDSATQKGARDAAELKALCAATNNTPADLPATLCTASPGTPAPATPPTTTPKPQPYGVKLNGSASPSAAAQ